MDLLSSQNLEVQQKINELERKVNKEKEKISKKLIRQKILLGAFLVDALENDAVDGLKQYTADSLLGFVNRQGDKNLMKDFIVSLGSEPKKKETTSETSSYVNSAADEKEL